EEVFGDDHIEAGRVRDQEDRRRVDVQIVYDDIRVLRCNFVHDALPHATGIHENVRLVHERQLAATALCDLEGVAHKALYAVRGVDARLDGDFVLRTAADHAAVARIRTLSALAHDDEIDV